MDIENTGEILKAMRVSANLNTDELAQMIGIARSHVYRLEHGKASPSLSLVKKWISATEPCINLVGRLLIPMEFVLQDNGQQGCGDGLTPAHTDLANVDWESFFDGCELSVNQDDDDTDVDQKRD